MDLVSQYRYGTDPVYVINEQIYTIVDYWNKWDVFRPQIASIWLYKCCGVWAQQTILFSATKVFYLTLSGHMRVTLAIIKTNFCWVNHNNYPVAETAAVAAAAVAAAAAAPACCCCCCCCCCGCRCSCHCSRNSCIWQFTERLFVNFY